MPDRRFRPEYMEMLCHLPRGGEGKSLAQVAVEMARRLNPFKARLEALAPGLAALPGVANGAVMVVPELVSLPVAGLTW